ncbi:MAG: RsmB/NOP family class I SAM-dependent RNA methyltransferase [Deltaproteobacteria bacterium]|nr:RsmB/NOP family class I SAM-dependent RNA methyltransferase [Deltaproteobacteria bacterium]
MKIEKPKIAATFNADDFNPRIISPVNTAFEIYKHIIPDFSLFQESLTKPFPVHLRMNRLLAQPSKVVSALRKKGIVMTRVCREHDTLYVAEDLPYPGNLLEYFLGHIHPQAMTSALAAMALQPQKHALVLDMCAAPGGKSAHLADLMENTGFMVCNDLYANRQVSLGHTLSRLGVQNSVVTGYQAQEFPLRQPFDYILADVPCSCEGRFRETSEITQYRETRRKAQLPDIQKKIILRGFDLLKDNGEMLYATCTYNPAENESVVNFLLNERDADLLPIHLGIVFEPGLTEWNNEKYDKRLTGAARLYPHHVNSVGFFMARIGRK